MGLLFGSQVTNKQTGPDPILLEPYKETSHSDTVFLRLQSWLCVGKFCKRTILSVSAGEKALSATLSPWRVLSFHVPGRPPWRINVKVWQEENGNDRFKCNIRETDCGYGTVAYEAGRRSTIVTGEVTSVISQLGFRILPYFRITAYSSTESTPITIHHTSHITHSSQTQPFCIIYILYI
jgi:hypothetical protein